MNFKRILNLSLCGGLLAGSAVAYATGEVKLGNGVTVDWDSFVAAINNPSTITNELPPEHETKAALAQANTAKTNADGALKLQQDSLELDKTALENAKKTRDAAVADTVTKSEAVTNAKNALANLKDSDEAKKLANDTVAAKKAYNDSVAAIPVKNNQIASLKTQQSKLQGDLQDAKSELQTLNSQLSRLESQLANLPKTTISSTVIEPWVLELDKYATDFSKVAYGDPSDLKIYYREEERPSGRTKIKVLCIAFKDKPADGNNWTEASPTTFDDLLYDEDAGAYKTKPYAKISLYLGPEYGAAYKSDNYYLEFTPGDTNLIVGDAAEKIAALKDNRLFQTVTNTPGDYIDEEAAKNLQAQIAEYTGTEATETTPAKIGKLQQQQDVIDGLNDQLNYEPKGADDTKPAGVNVQIKRLQDEIDTLNLEGSTNPKTLENLKKAWDDAVLAYNNYLESTANGIETAEQNLKTSKETLAKEQTKVDEAQAAIVDRNKKIEDADAAVKTAEANVETAQAKVDEAQRLANEGMLQNYYNVKLESDVTANTQIKPSGIKIDGDYHVITLADGVASLFNEFTGSLDNVAINGKVYNKSNGATANNVVWWNKANGTQPGRYFNSEGVSTTYSDLGALGFEVREDFGVDFDNNKLVGWTTESQVYNITIYEGPTGTSQKYAVVYKDNADNYRFKGANLPEEMENMFIESVTSDAKALNIPNLIYDGNKCDYVYISDKKQFYAPKEIKAKTLVYDRQFKAGKNASCLPFALQANMDNNINHLATYDTEDDKQIWFTKTENIIPANTPLLLNAKAAFTFAPFDEVTIAATPYDQKVIDEGSEEHPSKSYGIFKSVYPGEIRGESNNNRIYGLFSGEFKNISTTTKITPFRMVIYSTDPLSDINKAPRRISLRDEYGNVIDDTVTGVEGIEEAVNGLNIAGGQGEIIFTADANYGEVAIYSFDGKLAAIADVQEGTTTVNVVKGIYIVNGKKVMVK
ncbi:MAG: hypothetical protein K2M31_08860 [Muribaculaceae bacterium]|nr:hypothetical protein [Muribaculaceae bacterium]